MTWNDMPARWYHDYERGRPSYPAAVADIGGLPRAAAVLDLAAGTGKLTRLLSSRFDRVVAVEPDDSMRQILTTQCPSAETLAGSASQIPTPDASIDAVFAAQAFHWFDNATALDEIARVLRPHGAFLAMWNVPTGPPEPAVPAIERLLTPSWPEECHLPLDMSLGSWTPQVWERASTRSVFEEHREVSMPNPQTVDPEGLIAFFGSMGWIATMPDAHRLRLLHAVRACLTEPSYTLPWETRIHWTRLIDRRTSQ